jgi:uncharacterized OB-fold protein
MWLLVVSQEDDFFERNDAETCEDFKNKADYVEVKYGNWIRYTEDIHRYGIQEYECSECGRCMDYEGDYCSKCGAKMEGLITRWRR